MIYAHVQQPTWSVISPLDNLEPCPGSAQMTPIDDHCRPRRNKTPGVRHATLQRLSQWNVRLLEDC